MERQTSYSEEIKYLTNSPSVVAWETEIGKVLLGQRDHMIIRLGGVQGYIEVLWARSLDEELARRTFLSALRNFVQEWQPSRPVREYYFATILDLIGAYTPSAGFVKVLGHIQKWEHFGLNSLDRNSLNHDLHLKALIALQNYFPIPPAFEHDAPGFGPYVAVLRKHLKDPRYSSHALRRLIELEMLRLNDQDAVDAIRENVETIQELIPLLLNPSRRESAPRDLALVYIQGLVTGENVDEIFARAVKRCRASFEPLIPPVVTFEDGEVIKLYFTPEELEKYERLHDQASLVFQVATSIRETHDITKTEDLARMLEQTLNKSDEELIRFVGAVDEAGLYLAPGAAGPELYLPYGVVMPLNLHSDALSKYMLRVRLGEEPNQAVRSLFRIARAKAASK